MYVFYLFSVILVCILFIIVIFKFIVVFAKSFVKPSGHNMSAVAN